jgi:peptidoglycan/LPS O-acetylase OafA/YrhL
MQNLLQGEKMATTVSSPSPTTRRHDLDWLRTLAVLLIVPFHSLLVFVQNPDSVVYLKDTVDCFACDRVAGFIHQFHMPILFIIAGMSTAFALAKRRGGQYLRERVSRLLIPLVFGLAIVVPPMTYITQIAQGKTLTFWQHYANFFTFGPDITGRQGTFTPAHLWFILFLFVFSLVALPLLLLLRRKGSQGVMSGLARFFEKPMALLALGLFVAVGGRTEIMGAINPVYYLFVFLCGYLLMTDPRYQKTIDRDWPVMLLLGIILETLRQLRLPVTTDGTLGRALVDVAMEFNRWVWVLAILGIGHRLLNRGGKVLNYLSEASYPFYILHLLVLTGVSYFIVQIQTVIIVKYILIVLITFAITFLAYEGARRVLPLRFLLGMKTRP